MLIGLIGKKGAGKDTVANIIEYKLKKQGIKVERRQMAYNLKLACSLLTEKPFSDFEDNKIKNAIYEKPFIVDRYIVLSFLNHFGINHEMASNIYEYLKDQNFYKEVNSNRELLQLLGTDILRNLVGPDIHVNAATNSIKDPKTVYIFTDIRFENELSIKKSFDNSVFIGISRPTETIDTHESEINIDKLINNYANLTIQNNGTLDQLETIASAIVHKIF